MGCRPPRTGTQPAPIFTASWRFAFCTAMVFSFLRRVRRKGPHRRAPAYLCCPGLCPRQRTGAETGAYLCASAGTLARGSAPARKQAACPCVSTGTALARGSTPAQKRAAHPCASAGLAARNRMLFARGACSPAGKRRRKRKSPRGYGLVGFALCITGRAGAVRPLRAAVTAR